MHLHENPSIDLLLKLIYLLLIAGGVWLFFHYIFGWVLPLVIAYLLSRLIQKPVREIENLRTDKVEYKNVTFETNN